MNRLQDLIQRYCPNGAVFARIEDIADISIGEFVHKSKQSQDGRYPVYNGGTTNTGFYDDFNRTANKIIISARGANAGYVNRIFTNFWSGNSCYSIDVNASGIDWNYVYFCLKNGEKKLLGEKQKGGIPAVSKKQVEQFRIPLPPLPVQQEIVRILDSFTELTAELNEKLASELTARRKQYEHYRDELLLHGTPVCLADVADYSKDRVSADLLTEETYVGVDNLLPNKSGKKCSEHIPTEGNVIGFRNGDILIGNIRPYLKKIWKATSSGGTNGDVLVIRVKDGHDVSAGYLYHVLSSDAFFDYDMSNAKGAKMPRGDKAAVMRYQFFLPDISEQQRIVLTLNRFETLCYDLASGLPAEIAARQKQYEYYRDKLLTFKELKG